MPKTKRRTRRLARTQRVTVDTNRKTLPEPGPSTRLEQLRKALRDVDFGFTIFFTNELKQSVKFYQGAVIQDAINR